MNIWLKVGLPGCIIIVLMGCGSGANNSSEQNPDSGGDNPASPIDNPDTESDPPTGVDPENESQPRPNFLFIISDDQGLDASAQYPYSQDLPHTPVIDALAQRGLVFDNAWATPSCTTTRGSIISGQHGVNSGVTTTPSLLDTNTLTLQRFLGTNSSAVYSTAVVGKWHLAGGNTQNQQTHPNEAGVDYYAGNISGTLDSYFDWPLNINGVLSNSSQYHTTEVTDLAIDWIRQQDNPWFMWLAYVSPHSPFHLPPSHLHTQNLSGDASDIEDNPRAYYLAAIEAMDTEIGRLLDSLPVETVDNTLIVFLGDNGTPRSVIDTAVYQRSHSKGSLYEGGIRVPMVVAGSGVSRHNQREPALVNTVDLFATVSEAAGLAGPAELDGQSFYGLLSDADEQSREYNYSEFVDADLNGWTVRDEQFKLMVFADGSRELYHLGDDPRELSNLISEADLYAAQISQLEAFGMSIRSKDTTEQSLEPVDLTGAILVNRSTQCADYANAYGSTATDINNNAEYEGELTISVEGEHCVFSTNAIPNHNFNDGSGSFPNDVSTQSYVYLVPIAPEVAQTTTPLSLTVDNAILLNGVKVDILAAGCFGIGNGKTGCNDTDQPWRYDPMSPAAGFRVDSHNAHAQADGTYHYHGEPKALFSESEVIESPVIGFAADGFAIYGSYINDSGTVRKVRSSYRLKSGSRPSDPGQPGGNYDGTFRDDYEFISGLGDLDECNGVMLNGHYRYHITDDYPYVLGCFRGVPDPSFSKNR